MDNEKTIAEINEVIAKVEAGLEPGCEIGARDKMTLKGLLRANGIDRNIKFFPCKRENSARIVAHFVRTKGIPQSRFSINAQPEIFILCQGPATGNERQEVKPEKKELKVDKEVKIPKQEKPQQPVQAPKEKEREQKKTKKQEKPAKKSKAPAPKKVTASKAPAKKAKKKRK